MYTGPHLIKDNLVFGYDTGYGVADNKTSTRFYPGEPTTNAVPLSTFINTSNWTGAGWSGTIAVSADYDNTLELTSTNGWRTWRVNTGITSGGTVTVSYEYKMKTLATTNVFMLNLNGDQLGSYVNSLGSISAADTQDLSNWKTFTGTFTANSNSNLAIGLRGADGQALTDTIYVRNLQVELKGQPSPFTATSRSSTQSLIDLTKTTDMDLSNVSFDSTGQPEFDGTDDSINLGNYAPIRLGTNFTIECVVRPEEDKWMYFFYKGYGSNNSLAWGRHSSGDDWFFSTMIGGSYQNSYMGTATLNKYCHLVATYDGANLRLYENGVLKITSAKTHDMLTSSASAGIGGPDRYWNGKIPVTKIYSKVLTTEEVVSNFNAYKNRFDI